jgi:hypothetical protein
MNTATLRAVLNEAGDIIESGGWCRHGFQNGDRHCLGGALTAAVRAIVPEPDAAFATPYDTPSNLSGPAGEVYHQALRAVERRLTRDYGDTSSAYYWNDKQTDRRKVVRLLRRTARAFPVASAPQFA